MTSFRFKPWRSRIENRLASIECLLERILKAMDISQQEIDELTADVARLGTAIAEEHQDVTDAFGRLEQEIKDANGGNVPSSIRTQLDAMKAGLDAIGEISAAAKGEGQPSATGTTGTDAGSTGGTTDAGTGSTDTGTGDTQPTP